LQRLMRCRLSWPAAHRRSENAPGSARLRSPGGDDDPKTEIEVAEARAVVAAGGGAAVLRPVLEGTAADHTMRARLRPARASAGAPAETAVIVGAPLRDVAVHIIQPESVRLEPADGGRERVAVVPLLGPLGRRIELLQRSIRHVGYFLETLL